MPYNRTIVLQTAYGKDDVTDMNNVQVELDRDLLSHGVAAWRFEFASLFVHHVSTHRWRVLKVENADPITWCEAFVLGVRFTLVVSLEGCLRLR